MSVCSNRARGRGACTLAVPAAAPGPRRPVRAPPPRTSAQARPPHSNRRARNRRRRLGAFCATAGPAGVSGGEDARPAGRPAANAPQCAARAG